MATISPFRTAYQAERATRHPRPARTPLAVHLGRATARLLPTWRRARTALLSLTGFGCLTAAAWTLHLALGLAAAGVSVLLLEYLGADSSRR